MRWLLVEVSTFPTAIPHAFYGNDVTIGFLSVTGPRLFRRVSSEEGMGI
jgi:hypothetical protein